MNGRLVHLRDVWQPVYHSSKGTPFGAPGIESSDCPASAVDAEIAELLAQVLEDIAAAKATGATMYGPRLAEWPAAYVDARRVVEAELNALQNARMKAETSE